MFALKLLKWDKGKLCALLHGQCNNKQLNDNKLPLFMYSFACNCYIVSVPVAWHENVIQFCKLHGLGGTTELVTPVSGLMLMRMSVIAVQKVKWNTPLLWYYDIQGGTTWIKAQWFYCGQFGIFAW